MRRIFTAVVVLVLVAASALLWQRQDGGTTAGPAPSVSPSVKPTDDGASQYSDSFLRAVPQVTPIATQAGLVESSPTKKVPATVEVLSLEANDNSTVLRWKLSTPQETNLNSPQFDLNRANSSTSSITLVSKESDQKLTLGRYVQVSRGACTCSNLPYFSGPAGVELSAVFGPLDASATQVELNIRGFKPVQVPVTRK